MEISCPRNSLWALLAVAALGMAAGAVAEDAPQPWRWSTSAGPSLFAPRFHGLNNALMFDGVDYLNKAWAMSGAKPINAVGFQPFDWAYGGTLELGYQLNDDLRGGLRISIEDAPQSDTLTFSDVSPVTGTYFFGSSTSYTMSEKFNLPAVSIGVFLHKVFTFEEEPDLHLYLGGSGFVTTMVGAALRGQITFIPGGQPNGKRDVTKIPYDASLRGRGWGGGGTVGAEYLTSAWMAVFLEGGFDWLIIENIEKSGSIGGTAISTGRLITKAGNPILFDFSAAYLRLGIRVGINPAP